MHVPLSLGKLATWQGWHSFLSPTSQVELELEVEVAGHGCLGPQLNAGAAFGEVGTTIQDQQALRALKWAPCLDPRRGALSAHVSAPG